MFDANLLLRSGATDLTADELTPTGVDFGGPDLAPVTYQAHIPEAGGTTPTLTLKIQESDDNSTYRDFLTFEPITTTPGEYFVTGKSNARYRRYAADVGGTSPDYGAVIVAPVPAGRHAKF